MATTSRNGFAASPVARAASDRPNLDWYIDKAVQALVFLGGISAIIFILGIFVFIVSWVVWKVLDRMMGLRVEPDIERLGQDAGELGIESYPEFLLVPEEFDDEL